MLFIATVGWNTPTSPLPQGSRACSCRDPPRLRSDLRKENASARDSSDRDFRLHLTARVVGSIPEAAMLGPAAGEMPRLCTRAIRSTQRRSDHDGTANQPHLHGRADRYIAISTAVAEGSRDALPSRSEIVVIPTLVPNHLPSLAR